MIEYITYVKVGHRQTPINRKALLVRAFLFMVFGVDLLQRSDNTPRSGLLRRQALSRSTYEAVGICAIGLMGRSSSIRLMVQTGSFSSVSFSQAAGSMPLSLAVANRL